MSSGPSFIGFAPEEKQKAMATLNKVIELKDKNRAAAEESRGFEISEEEKYEKRFKPIVDAISTASGDILKYTNEKDVKFAAKEVIDAIQQFKAAQADVARDPGNQGYVTLSNAYAAQMLFAQAKLNFLDAAEAYSKATAGPIRTSALGVLQKARDDYAQALSEFQQIQIPIGFKQTVSIQQPPDKSSVFPGANLEISPTPAIPAVPPSTMIAPPTPKGPPPPTPAPGLVAGPTAIPKIPPPPKTSPKTKTPKVAAPTTKVAAPPSMPTSVPKSERWAVDLINLRHGVDAVPASYRTSAQNIGGSLAIRELPGNALDSVKLYLNDPTETDKRPAEIKLAGTSIIFTISDFNGVELSMGIENYIKKLLDFPAKPFSQTDLEGVISLHSRVFGGWGKTYWGTDLKSSGSLLMQKILSNPKYGIAVNSVKKTAVVKPVEASIGKGLKFKTTALPKASIMKLGPEGEYGNLIIDVPALYNDGRIIARNRGDQYGSNMSGGSAIVLDEPAAAGIKNLIIKRAMQTTIDKSPKQTQQQLKRLRKLAGFAISKKPTGGSKVKASDTNSGVIVVGDAKDIMERLKVATGVFDAGNRSKQNAQLISELASKLMELGAIGEPEYAKILKKYKA